MLSSDAYLHVSICTQMVHDRLKPKFKNLTSLMEPSNKILGRGKTLKPDDPSSKGRLIMYQPLFHAISKDMGFIKFLNSKVKNDKRRRTRRMKGLCSDIAQTVLFLRDIGRVTELFQLQRMSKKLFSRPYDSIVVTKSFNRFNKHLTRLLGYYRIELFLYRGSRRLVPDL